MTTTTQQIPASPAQRLADKILARTNNGRDLIDILHDIAQGGYDAPKSDRITASKFLFERGFGKCPKQSPATGSNLDPEHAPATDNNDPAPQTDDTNPAPATDNNDVEPAPYSIRGALRESTPAVPHSEPQSPRLVAQVKDAIHDALGPAPKADSGPAEATQTQAQNSMPPQPFDPSSIQNYIIEITNDGDTLVDSLIEIAYAADDDPTVTPCQRSRAVRILADRFMGTNPNAVQSGLCPECRRKWSTHPGSHDHPEQSRVVDNTEEETFDKEVWEGIIAELNQMEEDGIITPDPDAPDVDMSIYMPPEDFDMTPYEEEAAAAFRAENKLRLERRKQWPEIEERRRKKLAKIYPSHSDDGDPPDT